MVAVIRYTYVQQHDSTDCAAACLAMVCLHYHKETSITRLREMMGTDLRGTNLVGLSRCADQLGFVSQAIRVDQKGFLSDFTLPCIANILTKEGLSHFVVVFKKTKKFVVVGDPAKDLLRMPIENFLKEFTGVLLVLKPTENFEPGREKGNRMFSRYISLLLPHKKMFFWVILASLLVTVLGILSSVFNKVLMDEILPYKLENTLVMTLLIFMVVSLTSAIVDFERQYVMIYLSQKIDIPLMLGYFKHIFALPMKFFATRKTGDIITRFSDAGTIKNVFTNIALTLVLDIGMALISGVVLFNMNAKLFAIIIFTTLISVILVLIYKPIYKKINYETRNIAGVRCSCNSYRCNESDSKLFSSKPEIVRVNDLGRITAVSEGEATIQVTAGEVTRRITVVVQNETIKEVSSIEVDEFKSSMKVNETQSLNVSVYPYDAEEQTVAYKSSDPSVATVSQGGVITALRKGVTTISLSCGSAQKNLELRTYIATQMMKVSDTYLVLHPLQQKQIQVKVEPVEADQNLTFVSTNPDIVQVDSEGRVTAKKVGNAGVIISNEDYSKTIAVIVNSDSGDFNQDAQEQNISEEIEADDISCKWANAIMESARNEIVKIDGNECRYVTKEMLIALQKTGKVCLIEYENYNIRVSGADIKNPRNVLDTQLIFNEKNEGLEFIVNAGNEMPGMIQISFSGWKDSYKYLYLYNEYRKIYVNLNVLKEQSVEVSTAGTYLLTMVKIQSASFRISLLVGVGIVILSAFGGIYIALKKKYWFW